MKIFLKAKSEGCPHARLPFGFQSVGSILPGRSLLSRKHARPRDRVMRKEKRNAKNVAKVNFTSTSPIAL